MEQEPQPPPPLTAVFAQFLEYVRTTENNHQWSSDLEDRILDEQQELQRQRNLPTAIPSREYYFNLYFEALTANERLKYFLFRFTRLTDICFLKHLHNHVTLQSMQLEFEPRDEDNHHYEDLDDDDETQDVEIEHTIANFVHLKYLAIRAHLVNGAPRFAQALLKSISQNQSLRSLGIFGVDDFGLQELDWTKSKLEKLHIEECDLSFSTWKSLLSIQSLQSLHLATRSGVDREEPERIPRHIISRNHILRSLSVQCRTIRNLIIDWQETDITDLENMIRFVEFERLTLDLTGLELGSDETVPPPEDFQNKFSRICGLIHPEKSKVHYVFDSWFASTILSGCFSELLRTILRFPALVGMTITLHDLHDDFQQHSSQYLRILTENGEHLERLDISGIDAQDDEICKVIANLPRLKHLTAYAYPTPTIEEAVDAHLNLLQFDLELIDGGDSDKILADRARDRIETSLCRNRANRFTQRIASRTTCSETGVGLKLWPTILSNVDTDNVAAVSGVFQAFRNDIGRFLVQEIIPETPPKSEKMATGRKRSREEEVEE